MKNRSHRAFTLIELIIVIVVLGILATIAIVGYKAVIDRTNQSSAVTAAQGFDRQLRTMASYGDTVNNNPNDTDPRKISLLTEMVNKSDVPDQYIATASLSNNNLRVLVWNGHATGKWTRLFCTGQVSPSSAPNNPCSVDLSAHWASGGTPTVAAGKVLRPTKTVGAATVENPNPICLQFHKAGQDAFLSVSQYSNTASVVSTSIGTACPSATYGGQTAAAPTAATSGANYADIGGAAVVGSTAGSGDSSW